MNVQARLLWKCRRGTREMDILLESFLERHYSDLTAAEKELFESFLNESDPDILNWLMGRAEPGKDAYKPLLARLRTLKPEN